MQNFALVNSVTPTLEARELEEVLSYLNHVHGLDLTGYKRSSLMRRTLLRMHWVEVEDYRAYVDYLQQHPDEFTHLLDTIFINYTYFFRDFPVWDLLAHHIIPQLLASKAPNEPIRIWSAACASGEETYSLAMLLLEALGVNQFQQRVQLYGTDVDASAILQAQQGYYPAYKIETIPAALQKQYFEQRQDSYCWRPDFNGAIKFHLHNMIQDPPLTEIDLLVCRNFLMYLTAETQLRVLGHLHRSLQENGFLLLGNAEALVTPLQRLLFTPLNQANRIFVKTREAHSGYSFPTA